MLAEESCALPSAVHQPTSPAGTETLLKTCRVQSCSANSPAASVARTLKVNLPVFTGTPLNTPAEVSTRPGGKLLLPADSAYPTGAVPRTAVNVCVYA